MKRAFGALVVAALLWTSAPSGAADGDRAPRRLAKSYSEILAEIFGLKPPGATQAKPPVGGSNMMCMSCSDDTHWTPSPDDCRAAGLPPGCSSVRYCGVVPSDPRCMANPGQ
jgi:hypothetical protein